MFVLNVVLSPRFREFLSDSSSTYVRLEKRWNAVYFKSDWGGFDNHDKARWRTLRESNNSKTASTEHAACVQVWIVLFHFEIIYSCHRFFSLHVFLLMAPFFSRALPLISFVDFLMYFYCSKLSSFVDFLKFNRPKCKYWNFCTALLIVDVGQIKISEPLIRIKPHPPPLR